jgi:hypothetical protein
MVGIAICTVLCGFFIYLDIRDAARTHSISIFYTALGITMAVLALLLAASVRGCNP